ncbi:MAG: TetR/AcrR family transcriptional regulator [Alphaproteobacteria bacterium]|jgi:AcrR family transcriptional regulator|nr:TetR family transcriptional regulator [Rhodospirillaceae bacterium]MDP6406643.1 TetR/AcrR family transcriptional regulator [Alphaproteobacteria bacterium]MDP6622504.1 TetR/AcrR family transcriptional regulator [Alphaproteobacteria bacterium]|tara:strand:+ start:958 stop:1554 length:597 start_codon:yes stop_codon:yes gene_type:complete
MAAGKKSAAVRRRRGNRRELLLEAAARRFLYEGYAAASMRDIAADAGMQAGSIYYHFPSKADLLAAVHDEGMRRISDAVLESLEGPKDPWQRLEAACIAHLEFLLEGNIVVQALMQEMPTGSSPIRTRVTRLRDDYEGIFIRLLEDLKLPRGVDLHSLRLMLLGAMNWSFTWYRPGAETPRRIARKFVKYLRISLQAS